VQIRLKYLYEEQGNSALRSGVDIKYTDVRLGFR